MIIQTLPVDKLVPADYNPRKDLKPGDPEYEKLKRSIVEFGYVEPVIWNKTTGHVVGGHQRLKVLIDTGMTEVECVVVEMSEEKEKALNVALNKINGEWDKDKLSLLITDLQGADFDVSLTGFDAVEIDKLLNSGIDAEEDGFDVDAELEKPTFTKLGDVWTLGRHKVICGDSTRPETYAALMGGKQANLILTDPPYGIDYDKGTAGKIKNDKFDTDEGFYNFLHDAFSAMATYLAYGWCSICIPCRQQRAAFSKGVSRCGLQAVRMLYLGKKHIHARPLRLSMVPRTLPLWLEEVWKA